MIEARHAAPFFYLPLDSTSLLEEMSNSFEARNEPWDFDLLIILRISRQSPSASALRYQPWDWLPFVSEHRLLDRLR